MRIPFVSAGAYTLDSVNADAQSSINLFTEVIESKTGKNTGRMRGTPGLSVLATLPQTNVLGLWSGEDRLFAVAGTSPSHLYEVFADGSYNDHGSVGNALFLPFSNEYQPALIFPNASGGQLMVINGGYVWVDGGTGVSPAGTPAMIAASYTDLEVATSGTGLGNTYVTSPSLPFGAADVGAVLDITAGTGWTTGNYTIVSVTVSGYAQLSASPGAAGITGGVATETYGQVQAGTGAMMDTYGIVSPPRSNDFYISAIDNFFSWNSIDEGSKEAYADHILTLFSDHELLWIFGDLESTEIWQDIGAANFPFQRLQAGGVIHYGLAAQFSPARLGFNGLAWLAWGTNRGDVQACYAQGLLPQRISTHAIEEVWRSYPSVEDVIGYAEVDEGHEMWVLHFPSGDATWVYDFTASQQMGIPMWHQRGYWDGTTLHRQLQRSHAFGDLFAHGSAGPISASHFVGDHSSGKIYIQSFANLTDNGQPIFRQRACPHISEDNLRTFYSLFQLEMETGNQDITITFDYSKDHGHTFINAQALTAPAAGDPNAPNVSGFSTRLRWRRLGWTWDLVPRITTTSAARISITNAFMEGSSGSS